MTPIRAPQKPNIQNPIRPRIVAIGTTNKAPIVSRIKRTVNILTPLIGMVLVNAQPDYIKGNWDVNVKQGM